MNAAILLCLGRGSWTVVFTKVDGSCAAQKVSSRKRVQSANCDVDAGQEPSAKKVVLAVWKL